MSETPTLPQPGPPVRPEPSELTAPAPRAETLPGPELQDAGIGAALAGSNVVAQAVPHDSRSPGVLDAPDAAQAPTAAPDLSPAACAALLAEHFPALFGAGRALPIKLRIQADIQQRAPGLFNRKSLSHFLHRATTSTVYLKALAAAQHRYDLDGQAAGELSQEHRQAAVAELKRRRDIVEARRNAEREAARADASAARRAQAADQAAQDDARRDRATLLRSFETSTLTPANFRALKGLTEIELEARLSIARQEREQRALAPPPEPAARRWNPGPGPRPGSGAAQPFSGAAPARGRPPGKAPR